MNFPLTLPEPSRTRETPGPWWRDAVIYQVYVRSFADGNGDGVGDLLGIRTRLPYLRDLGVDALWITPFYASPMADGGYDVADYRAVDPTLGTLGDIDALVREAHGLGLRVIVDIVPNHTSDRHAWFQEALAAEPGAAARERYMFREGRGEHGELPPNDWESVFGGPAWTRVPDGSWYLHLFAPEQPDLNWHHPEVRAEFLDILAFWLNLGVDGFRIDVAHGMFKEPTLADIGHGKQISLLGTQALPYFDRDEVHEVYRDWRALLDTYPGDRVAVAEAWVPDAARLALYLRPDELHTAFNFHYLGTDWSAPAFRAVVDDSLAAVADVGAPATWVLSNHDVQRHVTRYGGGELGQARARAAVLLTLALPGSAYLYQGEELGLPEVTDLPDEVLQDPQWERSGHTDRGRDGCRVPMPWDGTEAPFGFGPPGSRLSWLPVPADWQELGVQAQSGRPDSMLELYREALRLRRTLPGLGGGTLRWIDAPQDCLAFERGAEFVCVVNFGVAPVTIPAYGRPLLAGAPLVAAADGGVVLPANSAVWWERTPE
ncbi:glycoside hydrolase family 13 protein [Embleya sp. NBC_00896]|uniref:glycoside hydrolase family 13 protein n=1 Tax=Embleya sp. NBC_00896 TaxID=2975961 RepID=UPI002F9068B4|nr:glycoside hydrolase family 13 protein [Embleya sp. NBC_00896]